MYIVIISCKILTQKSYLRNNKINASYKIEFMKGILQEIKAAREGSEATAFISS